MKTTTKNNKNAVWRRLRRLVLRFRHRIAHWLGWNHGMVKTWHSPSGRLMVGFKCSCGRMSGIHEAHPSADLLRAIEDAKQEVLGDES